MNKPVIKEVTLVRLLDAPREMVFKAWTDPVQLAKWWGPKHFTAPVCEMDVRPGGSLLIHMRADSGWVNVITGNFHEIEEPSKLVFTTRAFANESGEEQIESYNSISFEAAGNKTRLTANAKLLKLGPGLQAAADGMEEGWSLSLDKMRNTVADTSRRETITSRLINAPRQKVFNAFSNPEVLAKWWGPNGFTSTFKKFDFTPGGDWVFTLHGPNGKDFENHNRFVEIRPNHRIVLQHLSQPHVFEITFVLEDVEGKTLLNWHMVFEDLAEWEKAKPYVLPANEQNLDRLAAQVE